MSERDIPIVALATTLPARAGDGTPEFVLTLSRQLGSAVTIVAPRVRGCSWCDDSGGVAIQRFAYAPRRFETLADDAILPTLRRRPSTALQVPGLVGAMLICAYRAVRAAKAEVIHAHWIIPGGLLAMAVSRLTGVPYFVTAHGADAYALNGRLGRWLKTRVLRSASGVQAVSSEIKDRLEGMVPGCVTIVAPMGVDVVELRRRVGERSPEDGLILFVGRLADKKGVDVLLRALVEVPESWRLCVIGDGPERVALEVLASSLGLGERVEFQGTRVQADDVASAYARAAVVVVPSRTASDGDRDGTPVVLMEAMAAGVPVVASSLGGIAEHLRTGVDGLLVPEDDGIALAAAISAVLSDPDAASTRACSAVGVAEASFDVRRIADDLRRAFQGLAATTT